MTDIIGFRVIVNNVDDCYKSLGIFHNKWSCVPGRMKDYISTPKINNYKSLHTSLIGPNNQRVEIQIRTEEMHEYAERGIASHWSYKSSEKLKSSTLKEYSWLRDLVEIIEKGDNPEHFYVYTKLQMFSDNVFCFSPKGAVIKLPKDATPIDFAYAVHTQVGDTATGCKINGKDSPMQSILRNGDLVEIITSTNISPSLHWLSIAKTGKARASIKRHWQGKTLKNKKAKSYNSSVWIALPHIPGTLGEVSTLFGKNNANIIKVEMVGEKKDYLEFVFDIQVGSLKDFTSLISEFKQKDLQFKIIRHKKKNAILQRIFKNFKRN